MADEKMDVRARPSDGDEADVEGHAMRSGPEGLSRREGEGLSRREGEGMTGRRIAGGDDDDVEGHSFGLRGGSTRGD